MCCVNVCSAACLNDLIDTCADMSEQTQFKLIIVCDCSRIWCFGVLLLCKRVFAFTGKYFHTLIL